MTSYNSEAATKYLNGLVDPVARSAVIAAHIVWLDSFESNQAILSIDQCPDFDLLSFYRATVDAFLSPSNLTEPYDQCDEDHANETDSIIACLSSVENLNVKRYSLRFLNCLRQVSPQLAREGIQFYLTLFVRCVNDDEVIDAINGGRISEHSDRLENDLNSW